MNKHRAQIRNSLDPTRFQSALVRRGKKLNGAGQHEAAARLLTSALANGPAGSALIQLSFAQWKRGNLAAAQAAYDAAVVVEPGLPADVEYWQGIHAAEAGALGRAERHFRLCLARSPGHHSAAYNLASLLTARGELIEADALFASGLSLICGDGRPTTTHMLRLPIPGRPLGWPPPVAPRLHRSPVMPTTEEASSAATGMSMVYLVAADSRYIDLFARPLANSIARAGDGRVLLHLHAVNPDDTALKILQEMREGPVPCVVTTEETNLSAMNKTERRVYYACARYLVLPELLALYELPMLVADADQMVLRAPETLLPTIETADVALLRFNNMMHSILALFSATVLLVSSRPGGRRFAGAVCAWLLARMAEEQCMAWHLDQAALAVATIGLAELEWTTLDPALVHLDSGTPRLGSDAMFWSVTLSFESNAAKMETSTFRALRHSEAPSQ